MLNNIKYVKNYKLSNASKLHIYQQYNMPTSQLPEFKSLMFSYYAYGSHFHLVKCHNVNSGRMSLSLLAKLNFPTLSMLDC